MKGALCLVTVLAICVAPSVGGAADALRPLACDVGPVRKTYGGTDWFVLSCRDERTVIIYSMPHNPASPYYFMGFPKPGGGVRLRGEGIGDRKASRPALQELKGLSANDINALVRETKKAAALRAGGLR